MGQLKLYNSLTRKLEVFNPIDPPRVGMYTCGPTVYGPGHLGHARSYTTFDLLKRVLLYNGYQVKHILNITDVHDDMIKKANDLRITIQELAERYIPLFEQDLKDLNIIPADEYPRVTEYIPKIIKMVKSLVKKGYGYVEKDGSVYYDVSKFKGYGRLSGVKTGEAKSGTRVKTDKYEKEDVADFALWKGWKEGEPYWQSPWGNGRPGWHIECSVMAKKYLGDTIDLHAGAMDLKFPHHENEIAQSEAANGVKFVNYWFHAGLLEVEGRKMSKSLGNYIEIHEIKEKGFDPLALRYLFLTAHYRSRMNFTWKGLEAAQEAYQRLINHLKEWNKEKEFPGLSVQAQGFDRQFKQNIANDLQTPQALATLWTMIKDKQISDAEKYELLMEWDQVLGLNLLQAAKSKQQIPKEIEKLIDKREELRKEEKWREADALRVKIEEKGFMVEDTIKGTVVRNR